MLKKSLISIIIIVLSSYSVYSSETIRILEFRERFINHLKDLNRFTKNYNNTRDFGEFEISSNIFEIANSSWKYAYNLTTLIEIYYIISTDKDLNSIRPIIQSNIKAYIAELDESIDYINKLITRTHSHEIAISGTNLQEDLRKFRQYLQSIKLPIRVSQRP